MIHRLYRLCSRPTLLLRLVSLQAVLAILQGLLLGLLIPVLRILTDPSAELSEARPWLLAGAIGIVVHCVLTVLASPVAFGAAIALAADLRHTVMRHATTLPLGWFNAVNKARLSRALSADVDAASHLAVTVGAPAVAATLTPVTITAVTFAVDWRMGLTFLLVGPLAYLALRRAGRIASIAEVELEHAATAIAGRAIEIGQAQPVLRAAGIGRTGTPRFRAALDEHRRAYRTGLSRSMQPDLTYTAVVMAGFVAVLVVGTQLFTTGSLTAVDTVALLILAVRFLEPLSTLIELIGAVRAMDNATGRIESILHTPSLPSPTHRDRPATATGTGITLEDVTFRYPGARANALSSVSFHCPEGTTTALIGASGSGKTSALRLIARFFDPDTGRVQIGGVDVRDVPHDYLLDQIAVIFQDVLLFDATIAENIRLARPDATDQELTMAVKAAGLAEVLARLPEGIDTLVGERGAGLSGGERQRVAIARALLKNAPIVLVDEATSALDPENEQTVARAISALAATERTVVIIAHRPATIAAADQIVVLDRGTVAESGTPSELLLSNGLFARIEAEHDQTRAWRIDNRPTRGAHL